MRLLFITPMCLHWRARRQLTNLDNVLQQIRDYSGHNIDYVLDTENFSVVDYDENRILGLCPVTFNLDRAFWLMEGVKSYWYYKKHLTDIMRKPSLYNQFIYLKHKYYGN